MARVANLNQRLLEGRKSEEIKEIEGGFHADLLGLACVDDDLDRVEEEIRLIRGQGEKGAPPGT